MSLINELPRTDIKTIETYAKRFSSTSFAIGTETFLKVWASNKENLYKLLGNKFIHKFTTTGETYLDRIECCNLREHKFIKILFEVTYDIFVRGLSLEEKEFFKDLRRSIGTDDGFYHSLSYNHIELFTLERNGEYIFKYQSGMKLIKELRKIIKMLVEHYNFNESLFSDFEDFRIKHSMLLEQKDKKEEIYISIHPMDYMTMSDNDNNWTSCMSWKNKGEFRLGTFEMMNSNNVLVVYTKSNSKYTKIHHNISWNSKTWRTLVIYDENFIISNKQYPYKHEGRIIAVLNELKRLAKENLNNEYKTEPTFFDEYADNISLSTRFMYNDFLHSDYKDTYIIKKNLNDTKFHRVFLSGPAFCLECGDDIYPYCDDSERETEEFLCEECFDKYNKIKCPCCTDMVVENELITLIDNKNYDKVCPWCYSNRSQCLEEI